MGYTRKFEFRMKSWGAQLWVFWELSITKRAKYIAPITKSYYKRKSESKSSCGSLGSPSVRVPECNGGVSRTTASTAIPNTKRRGR